MKINQLLEGSKQELIKNNIEDAGMVARILLQYVFNMTRTELLRKDTQEVEEEQKKQYQKLLQQIIEGKPLQYIIKQQEFYGLPFYVDENVLIPQPDTEILVEEVLHIATKENKKEILDLGTGSGCIGISLARYLKNARITVSDVSKKALEIAEKNSKRNQVIEKITFVSSNLFEKIEKTFDIIVSNPPYIETNVIPTLSKQVQQEPHIALDGGKDGLSFYRIILNEAPKYLTEKGYLCMEIGYDQREKVMELAQKTGNYKKVEAKQDLSGNDRIIVCQK